MRRRGGEAAEREAEEGHVAAQRARLKQREAVGGAVGAQRDGEDQPGGGQGNNKNRGEGGADRRGDGPEGEDAAEEAGRRGEGSSRPGRGRRPCRGEAAEEVSDAVEREGVGREVKRFGLRRVEQGRGGHLISNLSM